MIIPFLCLPLLLGSTPPAPTSTQEPTPKEWPWDAKRVSSAYLLLAGEFGDALASGLEWEKTAEAFRPKYLELAKTGDPDAKRWILENANWKLAAKDKDLARRQTALLDELLQKHGETWRAEALEQPIGELWWIPHQRSALVECVDRYLKSSTYKPGRAAVAIQLADAIFGQPRNAEDQNRAERLYRLAAQETMRKRDREQTALRLSALKRQRIGKLAADIVGKDVDGRALTLSDLRGKIVVLEFWGFW